MKDKQETEFFDVLVVGAGPAGAVLALRLAEAGVKVLLAEKDAFGGQKTACGGLFDYPYYRRYFENDDLVEQRIYKNTFIMPWGEVTYNCDQLTVKRRVFDKALAELAADRGADYRIRTRVSEYQLTGDKLVVATLNDLKSNRTYAVQTRIIAFADGPRSLAAANPRFNPEKNKPFWAYAYAYEVDGVPFEANTIKIYLDKKLFPWGYGWIFPNEGDSNIGVGTVAISKMSGAQIKDKLFEFIEEYPLTAELLREREVLDKRGGFIPMWLMNHFADDAQVVLGDAAGMVSPLFGAGIDYAMDAAEACARVLAEALKKDDTSYQSLQAYELAIKNGLVADLKKQMLVAKIIIWSMKFGKSWPVRILAVIAFGAKYNRWNKIKILLYPLLGRIRVLPEAASIDHK